MLGLRCCKCSTLVAGERGLLFVAVQGLLTAVVPLAGRAWALGTRVSAVTAHGLSSCGSRDLEHGFSCCGAGA